MKIVTLANDVEPFEIVDYVMQPVRAGYTQMKYVPCVRVRVCTGNTILMRLSSLVIIDAPPVAEVKCIGCRRLMRRIATGE